LLSITIEITKISINLLINYRAALVELMRPLQRFAVCPSVHQFCNNLGL